jgi:hypothetical protein
MISTCHRRTCSPKSPALVYQVPESVKDPWRIAAKSISDAREAVDSSSNVSF